MILSTDRTVLYFSFRFFFSVNDTILTQPEPKKEWLRQQHHMGEVQTDFHPCDAVLSTGIQVKPLPFCFSTFLPFLLFWIKFIHRPSRIHSNCFTSSAVPQPKIFLGAEVFLFGFVFWFYFPVWPLKKRKEIQLWFLLETSTVLSWTDTFPSIRSCLGAENVQNKNREWLKEHLYKSCHC